MHTVPTPTKKYIDLHVMNEPFLVAKGISAQNTGRSQVSAAAGRTRGHAGTSESEEGGEAEVAFGGC